MPCFDCLQYFQGPDFHTLSVTGFLPAVRSRTLLQVKDEYPDEVAETVQFNLNSSDYLKAAAPSLASQNKASLGEVMVEVSEIERKSQENKVKPQKR